MPGRCLLLVPLAVLLAALPVLAQAPVHEWSRSFGDDEYNLLHDLAVDPWGYVTIMGEFSGTLDFGGGPLVNLGGYDLFVARFDAAGNHVWSRQFGLSNNSGMSGNAVAADASGNVYVTGSMAGPVDFGGGALPYTGFSDAYLVKFDGAGNHLWSRGFGTVESTDIGLALACDGAGNILLGVDFSDSVDFGGGMLTTSDATPDIGLAKFDPAGTHLWSKSFGDSLTQEVRDITCDSADNVILTGEFRGYVDFGGGTLTSAHVGTFDVFLAKFDALGNHLWSDGFGDTNQQWGNGVAVDPSDNVLLSGWFDGEVDFGGGLLPFGADYEIHIAKFDAFGNHLWSRSFGGPGIQRGYDVAADAQGNVVLTGTLRDSVDFGGGTLVSAGRNDVYLARFDPAGNHLWSANYGDDDTQYAYDVEYTGANDLYLAGGIQGELDLGGGSMTGYIDGEQPYLARFSPAEPTGIPLEPGVRPGLGPVHPNPFGPSITIPFVLQGPGEVEIVVHDVTGRHVATLLRGPLPAGSHGVTWSGRDDSGRESSAGIYFVRLTGRDGSFSTKLTLLD